MTVQRDVPRAADDARAEDDWFGEGSAFDTGEELAAALLALAGTVDPRTGAPAGGVPEEPRAAHPAHDGSFEILAPFVPGLGAVNGRIAAGPASGRPAAAPASAPPERWSVRTPGQPLLPPRLSGRSGWSIRNSVTVLHRTEQVMARLREDAVEAAFLAAAEAFGRGPQRTSEGGKSEAASDPRLARATRRRR